MANSVLCVRYSSRSTDSASSAGVSADAAAKTLELVQDSYGRGAASILDLLDAQNAALTAEFAAETSVYDFLDDWAEVRRSIGEL